MLLVQLKLIYCLLTRSQLPLGENTMFYTPVYPAKIVNATAVTPILSFTDSNGTTSIATCTYTFSSYKQQLSFSYQIASWDGNISKNTPISFVQSLSSYTIAILISWLSNETYSLTAPAPLPPVVAHNVTVQTRGLILSPGDR
ncbi:hypothetical protein HK100_004604 [Physocladia obscura]|uniref:Uncharacterized protein n=1 Tax=Physocladia obscura TaxID=109957 RepID=A0AAD5SSW7_9FUNG|nr:hypothetical protein HK100_004604 [Physocladia obscura]